MAVLAALIYPDQETAQRISETVYTLDETGYARVIESALVIRETNGDVTVVQERSRNQAFWGAVTGGIIGAVFGLELMGVMAGALSSISRNSHSGTGSTFAEFIGRARTGVPNGGGAVLAFIEGGEPDRVLADLGAFGGELVSTELTPEQIEALRQELERYRSQTR